MERQDYKVLMIKLEDIEEPREPIRLKIDPDKIRELSESIEERGLSVPIVLKAGEKPYEISEGHRRYLAFKMLGRTHIPAFIRELSPETLLLSRTIENIQRENLSPMEQGKIYKILCERLNLTQNALGRKIGKGGGFVSVCIRSLELPFWAQSAIQEKQVAFQAVIELTRIDDENTRDMYMRYACENGATVEVCKGWVEGWRRMKHKEIEALVDRPAYNPHSDRPVLFTCKLCTHPTDLKTMTTIYLCPACDSYLFRDGPHPDELRTQ